MGLVLSQSIAHFWTTPLFHVIPLVKFCCPATGAALVCCDVETDGVTLGGGAAGGAGGARWQEAAAWRRNTSIWKMAEKCHVLPPISRDFNGENMRFTNPNGNQGVRGSPQSGQWFQPIQTITAAVASIVEGARNVCNSSVATRSSSALSLRSAATCAMSPVSCNSTLPFASLGSSSCLAKELLPNQDNQAQI